MSDPNASTRHFDVVRPANNAPSGRIRPREKQTLPPPRCLLQAVHARSPATAMTNLKIIAERGLADALVAPIASTRDRRQSSATESAPQSFEKAFGARFRPPMAAEPGRKFNVLMPAFTSVGPD